MCEILIFKALIINCIGFGLSLYFKKKNEELILNSIEDLIEFSNRFSYFIENELFNYNSINIYIPYTLNTYKFDFVLLDIGFNQKFSEGIYNYSSEILAAEDSIFNSIIRLTIIGGIVTLIQNFLILNPMVYIMKLWSYKILFYTFFGIYICLVIGICFYVLFKLWSINYNFYLIGKYKLLFYYNLLISYFF